MSGVNKAILIGNLGADPEVKHLDNGSTVANLRIATTESYKDRDGNRKDMTEWHDLEMWDGLAKIAEQYLTKGDKIYAEGKIKSDTWEDDQGNKRKRVKIRVFNMTMLSAKGENTGAPANKVNETAAPDLSSDSGDDLPF